MSLWSYPSEISSHEFFPPKFEALVDDAHDEASEHGPDQSTDAIDPPAKQDFFESMKLR
jgi:hypothetical protein